MEASYFNQTLPRKQVVDNVVDENCHCLDVHFQIDPNKLDNFTFSIAECKWNFVPCKELKYLYSTISNEILTYMAIITIN